VELSSERRLELINAIIKSQHCQRNWDLSKNIPDKDLGLLTSAASHCPSKQNVAFYTIHVVTNQDLITQIHSHTAGFAARRDENNALIPTVKLGPNDPVEFIPNDQVLANAVFIFEDNTDLTLWRDVDKLKYANNYQQFYSIEHGNDPTGVNQQVVHFDRDVAIGIGSAYLALIAVQLGYSTGFCACMDQAAIKKVLGSKRLPLLMVGVGYPDDTKIRNASQSLGDFMYPTKPKQPIDITFHR
jgi:nitroreductase